MKTDYKIPSQTCIGHVHLKVSDIKRSLHFYCDLLGFEITTMYGTEAAFISAGGYHHHIGLNTWYSKNFPLAHEKGVGLFHTAILYPTRKDLATIYDRILKAKYPFSGAADHGVSQALYLNDPDNNGVELYWDRPKEEWLYNEDGTIVMFSTALDLENLLKELEWFKHEKSLYFSNYFYSVSIKNKWDVELAIVRNEKFGVFKELAEVYKQSDLIAILDHDFFKLIHRIFEMEDGQIIK